MLDSKAFCDIKIYTLPPTTSFIPQKKPQRLCLTVLSTCYKIVTKAKTGHYDTDLPPRGPKRLPRKDP